MSELSFEIPVPPSANRYWRVAHNRIIVTNEAKAYKEKVFYKLRHIFEPLRKDIAINVTVFRKYRRGDLDNFLKIMLDALEGIVYLNDSQIVEIHAFRDDDKDNPHVKVLAYELESV